METEGLTKDTNKKTQIVGKEKVVKPLEIKEGENFRKEVGMHFKKEDMIRNATGDQGK